MTSSANPCQTFFEQNTQTKNRAQLLQQSGHAVEWETMSASPHSPGPVLHSEYLIRLVVNPIHVDPSDGSIKPSLISDVKDKGASTQRLTHITQEEAIDAGHTHAMTKNVAAPDGKQRSICGIVKLSVQEVRDLVVASKARAFGIFDTALPTNQSHADVLQLVAGDGQEARSARIQLFALASNGFEAV
jgi:hypothetical protein